MKDETKCDRCLHREIEPHEDHGKLVYRQYCAHGIVNFPHLRNCMRYQPDYSESD